MSSAAPWGRGFLDSVVQAIIAAKGCPFDIFTYDVDVIHASRYKSVYPAAGVQRCRSDLSPKMCKKEELFCVASTLDRKPDRRNFHGKFFRTGGITPKEFPDGLSDTPASTQLL